MYRTKNEQGRDGRGSGKDRIKKQGKGETRNGRGEGGTDGRTEKGREEGRRKKGQCIREKMSKKELAVEAGRTEEEREGRDVEGKEGGMGETAGRTE